MLNSIFLAKLQSQKSSSSLDGEAPVARPLNNDVRKVRLRQKKFQQKKLQRKITFYGKVKTARLTRVW